MKPSHHRIIPNWLLLICAIVIVSALGYLVWFYCVKSESITTPTPTATTTNTNANTNTSNTNSTATADWKTYTNSTYGYSIKYPKDWTVSQVTTADATTDAVKNSNIQFKNQDNIKLRITSESKSRWNGATVDKYATDYITPKDYSTITDKKSYKIGDTTGIQELVTITKSSPTDLASKGIWYFSENENYYYAFITTETTQSLTIKNMLSTFQFTK